MKTPTPVKINKKSSISMLDLYDKGSMIEPIAPKVKVVAYIADPVRRFEKSKTQCKRNCAGSHQQEKNLFLMPDIV